MEAQKNKTWISFRVKPAEYEKINGLFLKTAHRKLSEYVRNVLLQKPVFIRYRNESADQFLSEMLLLKQELNAIGNNYNQAVKKLHTLNHIEEVKFWLSRHELMHAQFLELSEQIYTRLNEIHQQWSSE